MSFSTEDTIERGIAGATSNLSQMTSHTPFFSYSTKNKNLELGAPPLCLFQKREDRRGHESCFGDRVGKLKGFLESYSALWTWIDDPSAVMDWINDLIFLCLQVQSLLPEEAVLARNMWTKLIKHEYLRPYEHHYCDDKKDKVISDIVSSNEWKGFLDKGGNRESMRFVLNEVQRKWILHLVRVCELVQTILPPVAIQLKDNSFNLDLSDEILGLKRLLDEENGVPFDKPLMAVSVPS